MAATATLPLSRSRAKRGMLASLLLTATLTTGCFPTESEVWLGSTPPPVGIPARIATYWQTNVAYAADPANNGALNPGFAGRLYLFGPSLGYPMTGDGSILVEMLDESQEGSSIKRETWEIDPQTLARLQRRDRIGWGYTLFLPSREYKPEMSKIRLKTCYRPAKGAPQYTESVITLASDTSSVHQTSRPVSLTMPPPPPMSFNPSVPPMLR
jgi:hypothetical protein